jgi:hypothetical protein
VFYQQIVVGITVLSTPFWRLSSDTVDKKPASSVKQAFFMGTGCRWRCGAHVHIPAQEADGGAVPMLV